MQLAIYCLRFGVGVRSFWKWLEMIFSEKLQLIRKNKGLTQEELAEKLSVSRQAVAKWESGQGYPEITNLIQISNLFHVTDLETQIERCLAEDRNITGRGSMYISAML